MMTKPVVVTDKSGTVWECHEIEPWPKMKPHTVTLVGERFVLLNQAGVLVTVPGTVTVAELDAAGIVVRLHKPGMALTAEDFEI